MLITILFRSVSCFRTFYLSMCSSEYKNPDFVISCVFVLYVEIIDLAGPTIVNCYMTPHDLGT